MAATQRYLNLSDYLRGPSSKARKAPATLCWIGLFYLEAPMPTSRAILVGAALIAIARVVAPYEIASGPTAHVWRVNVITGNIRLCRIDPDDSIQCE
jgi:hypothetical protein